MTTRSLGLAPLSLIGHAPTEIVDAAAAAGYDFVGLRVRPVTATERSFDLQPGSPTLADTLRRLDDGGLEVVDIEFLLLDGTDQRDVWRRMYDAGAALGASTLTVAASDPDRGRLVDTLGRLVEDGREAGIVPTLEAISYQAVSSVGDAADIARQAGAKVLLDTLHLGRVGTDPAEVAKDADLMPVVQVCDGPLPGPRTLEDRVVESRSKRMIPGTGDLRVAEVLRHLPSDVPVSVETPDAARVEAIGAVAWARELHDATARLLDGAHPRAQEAC